MNHPSAAATFTKNETEGFPTRLFPTGHITVCDNCPVPSRDAAKAVDFIYPSENRFRQVIAKLVAGDSIELRAICEMANLACAIIKLDEDVRTRLINGLDNGGLILDEINLAERRENAAKFISTLGFRHLMARAVCGADDGQHTDDLVNLIIVLAESDKMIASDVSRTITSFH